MNIDKLIELIEDKIREADNCEDTEISEEYLKGYMSGLKMAQDIIKEQFWCFKNNVE